MADTAPIRPADPSEFPDLAHIRHEAWHDAHAPHVPVTLLRHRTYETFLAHISEYGDRLRVAGPLGAPSGLCVIAKDEIDQLFISRPARGTGLAARLLSDGEARLRQNVVTLARLDCVRQNTRALRFYERCGWRQRGIETTQLETAEGPFDLDALVFTKRLL